MKRSLAELYALLLQEDEVTLLELLDLNTEEILTLFKYKVRRRHDYISKFYEESREEEETQIREEERYATGRGSDRSYWQEEGYDLEDESY